MGLISDYLEQCRDRIGNIDPCMIICGGIRGKLSSYYEINHTLIEYSNSKNDEQKKLLRQQLIERSSELETIKSSYLLGEKLILSVQNTGKLQSSLIVDIVNLFLAEIHIRLFVICEK